jgi:outer membrane protein OmpA-like peptidoglycan-associated protein/ABC-type nitrate/sulfonate/bicarbonate transport system substrate-binding protein
MNKDQRAKGCIVAAVLWCVILALLAVAYKLVIQPHFSEKLEESTGSASQYQQAVVIAVDSFSGYSILRSPELRDELKQQKIRVTFEDDGGDYEGRIKALKDRKVNMAVFTIDSFIASGAALNEYPASIVLILDETTGADAVVAYKEGVSSIQDLDNPDARFVLTPNSPSEFLARIILAHFSLPGLPERWSIGEDGAEGVYKAFCSAKKTDKRAYVLWEPYVSKALEEDGAHVLLDSGQIKGYIIDVLVVERNFLRDHTDVVEAVLEAYLRTAYSYKARTDGMVELVMADAKEYGGDRLSKEQASKLVEGIRWKNTLENYTHFGLAPQSSAVPGQHLEDIIGNISDVLVQTKALNEDPVGGDISKLYYDQILRSLNKSGFHPSRKLNLLENVDTGLPDLESALKVQTLPALSERQWDELAAIGEMKIKPISFGRGGARINVQSQRELKTLATRLASFPTYYLKVVGHTRAEGDADANLALARQRAAAAAKELSAHGVHENRVRVVAAKPSKGNGSAQAVSFVVGRPPY